MHGHQDMVQVLLGQGAELNAKDKGGWLPLHYAAKSGYLNTVKLLVDNGMTIFVFIKTTDLIKDSNTTYLTANIG